VPLCKSQCSPISLLSSYLVYIIQPKFSVFSHQPFVYFYIIYTNHPFCLFRSPPRLKPENTTSKRLTQRLSPTLGGKDQMRNSQWKTVTYLIPLVLVNPASWFPFTVRRIGAYVSPSRYYRSAEYYLHPWMNGCTSYRWASKIWPACSSLLHGKHIDQFSLRSLHISMLKWISNVAN
jgi:hypothetical protein